MHRVETRPSRAEREARTRPTTSATRPVVGDKWHPAFVAFSSGSSYPRRDEKPVLATRVFPAREHGDRRSEANRTRSRASRVSGENTNLAACPFDFCRPDHGARGRNFCLSYFGGGWTGTRVVLRGRKNVTGVQLRGGLSLSFGGTETEKRFGAG